MRVCVCTCVCVRALRSYLWLKLFSAPPLIVRLQRQHAMVVVTCPAVLCCHYVSANINHELFLAFALDVKHDAKLVSLRMRGDQTTWSGWHGHWEFVDGGFNVKVHYNGDDNSLRTKRVILFDSGRQADSNRDASQFAEHCSCGKMWDRKGFVFVRFFIKTLVLTQRQLDYDDWEHV